MKKLIFDMDGTLIDSMEKWVRTMVRVLENNGVSYPDNILDIIAPLSLGQSAIYFREELGMDKSVEEILGEIDAMMIKEYETSIQLKDNALTMLKALKERGYSLNILTASPHRMLDKIIARLDLAPLFDNIWSAEDLGYAKNNPEIYRAVAKKLGTTTDGCRFFDDNINALRTAHSAGVETVAVYDNASRANEDELKSFCDRYIYNFSEVI